MNRRTTEALRSAVVFVLSAACAGCSHRVATGPRIYVLTDLEGASGVYRFAQTREEGPLQEKAREYLMEDLAAVVRGFRDAGASEVVLLDGHGSGAFVPHLAEPGGRYLVGKHPSQLLWGLDGSYAGIAMIACHAMNGTSDGVLNHTQSSKSENRYWYNGVESGELAQAAIVAGHYGVPPIMVSGDVATCREATRFFGPACVTVAVKEGINRESATLYPFAETRKALYEGARQAVAAIPHCKPYQVAAPIQVRKQWRAITAGTTQPREEIREGTITDPTRLLDF
jgi:D-amino peptidase